MNTLIVLFIFVLFLVGALMTVNVLLSVTRPDAEKISPYECGFSPLGDARQKFSVIFYLVALIFLIFDLEILFLFPFAVVLYEAFLPAFWVAILFLLLLTIGFIYEMSKKVLTFVKH